MDSWRSVLVALFSFLDLQELFFCQETFAALANLPSRAGTNMQAQIKVGPKKSSGQRSLKRFLKWYGMK